MTVSGLRAPIWGDEKFGKTVVMVVPHWIVCLKMAKIANFILYIFYQNENPHIHSWPHTDLVNSPPSLGPQGRDWPGPGKLEAHPCPVGAAGGPGRQPCKAPEEAAWRPKVGT